MSDAQPIADEFHAECRRRHPEGATLAQREAIARGMTAGDDCSSSDAEEPTYLVAGEWLVVDVGEHTCGTGPDGHYGHNEPGCGLEPVARIRDLLDVYEKHAPRASVDVAEFATPTTP